MAEDIKANERWPEYERVGETIISDVFPRLIGALERDGRNIKPCFIHGDLWEGNTGISNKGRKMMLFDAGSHYAHNETEVADWRCPYNKVIRKIYTETYQRMWGNLMSETVEEWDDRNRMYSVYHDIMFSVNHMQKNNGRRILHLPIHRQD